MKDNILSATTPLGIVRENVPYSYARENKNEVPSKFVLNANILSFDVASYTGTLVIDPQLEWATYYGGKGAEPSLAIGRRWGPGWHGYDVRASTIKTDTIGYIYIIGTTNSFENIATLGSYQDALTISDSFMSGSYSEDGFVAKFNSQGFIEWATYYGGNESDWLSAVSIEGDDIYITGATSSTGMSTPGAHQVYLDTTKWQPSYHAPDGIIAKFKTNGQRVWATYYGGEQADYSQAIVTHNGMLYLSGQTNSSTNIATPNAHKSAINTGEYDNILAKFDSSGKRIWSTYYGGQSHETATALALDDSEHIYLLGNSSSRDNIATPGSHRDVYPNLYPLFLAKFNSEGTRIWGTYIAVQSPFESGSIACDKDNNVYIAGSTAPGDDIGTVGAYKESMSTGDVYDAFLIKFGPPGNLIWSTYFGGNGVDDFFDIVIDKNEDICLAGSTWSSTGIATSGAWRTNVIDSGWYNGDGMFVKFDKNGNRLWSTYYGGNKVDKLQSLAVDVSNNVYLLGVTASDSGIAIPGHHQDSLSLNDTLVKSYDYFLLKATPDSIVYIQDPTDTVICMNTQGGYIRVGYIVPRSFRRDNIFTVQLSDSNGNFSIPTIIGIKPSTASGYIDCMVPVSIPKAKGYRVRVVSSAPYYISNDNGKDIEIRGGPEKPIASADSFVCVGDTLHLSATSATSGVGFSWIGPNGFTADGANVSKPNMDYPDTGNYIVTTTPFECKISDTIFIKILDIPVIPFIAHNAPVCEGDTLWFKYWPDSNTNILYTWTIPDTSYTPKEVNTIAAATKDFAGLYILTANLYGCISIDSAYIQVKHRPVVKASSNSPLTEGDDLELYATADSSESYSWTGPNQYKAEEQNPVLPGVRTTDEGSYIVTCNYQGCIDSAATVVQVAGLSDDHYIVFPNPNSGRFNIKGNLRLDQDIPLIVLNASGQEVYKEKVSTNKRKIDHMVTLPAVANGHYFLRLSISGKEQTIPFTVIK